MSVAFNYVLQGAIGLTKVGYFLVLGFQCLVGSPLDLHNPFLYNSSSFIDLVAKLFDLPFQHTLFLGKHCGSTLCLKPQRVILMLELCKTGFHLVVVARHLSIPSLLFHKQGRHEFMVARQLANLLLQLTVSGCQLFTVDLPFFAVSDQLLPLNLHLLVVLN